MVQSKVEFVEALEAHVLKDTAIAIHSAALVAIKVSICSHSIPLVVAPEGCVCRGLLTEKYGTEQDNSRYQH